MLRKTPPLTAAEAFLTAAEAPSFKVAADILALSPSAFSRRIQLLEAFVGAQLFDRSGPVIALTAKGKAYREAIAPALETIRLATSNLKDDVNADLRISVSASIAVDWLMPRLRALNAGSDMQVKVVIGYGSNALSFDDADMAIVGGFAESSVFPSERLLALEGVPVTSPNIVSRLGQKQDLAILAAHKLLYVKTPGNLWPRWLQAAGQDHDLHSEVECFDSIHLMYEAATHDLGFALAIPIASERFLSDHRLRACGMKSHPLGVDYRLVYRNRDVKRRAVTQRFRDYLYSEVHTSLNLFKDLTQTGA